MADVHESMIIHTRVGAFRACTESMPAHIDGDSDWPQVNYYVRGGARRSLDRGTLQGHEMQGCRLFIGQNRTGGHWLEVGTDPREPSMVTMVQFRAARQLHFVDTHRRAIRGVTHGFVRSIPFDNKDICQRICKLTGNRRMKFPVFLKYPVFHRRLKYPVCCNTQFPEIPSFVSTDV